MVKRAGTANIVGPEIMHLGPERLISFGVLVLLFQFEDQRHQRLGHETSAKIAETALFVGTGHEAVEKIVGHRTPALFVPARPNDSCQNGKATIRSQTFMESLKTNP